MGTLRDKMLMEMELRNYSPRTIKSYVGYVAKFAKHFDKSPDKLGETEIKSYLHHLLKAKQASASQANLVHCSLKFFYTQVLKRTWDCENLPTAKKPKRLPTVLSRFEVTAILNCVTKLKYRVFLMTTYSGGLRISETANLKVRDIDSRRMQLRVVQGKGNKDRYTLLSQTLLKHLRVYWQIERPNPYLFPNRKGNPMELSVIQRAFKDAKKKPGSTSLLLSIP
jgi:site-specific recombinase XerD